MIILGIDVGGTFVDFVLFDSGARQSSVLKRSRSQNVAETVVDGVKELSEVVGIDPADIDLVIHGTTVATNALLEHKGAKTGMLTQVSFLFNSSLSSGVIWVLNSSNIRRLTIFWRGGTPRSSRDCTIAPKRVLQCRISLRTRT